jgi:hypothetical protein
LCVSHVNLKHQRDQAIDKRWLKRIIRVIQGINSSADYPPGVDGFSKKMYLRLAVISFATAPSKPLVVTAFRRFGPAKAGHYSDLKKDMA